MPEVSTKPYLIRAIVEWCIDAGFTPYVAVAVDASVRVPQEFVRNGEIVLNVSSLATHRLQIGNEAVEFQARFGGVARDVYVPIGRVVAVYARENGQGMAFEVPRTLQQGAQAPGDGDGGGENRRDVPGEKQGDGARLRAVEAPKHTASLVPVALSSVPTSSVPTSSAASTSEADNASDLGGGAPPADPGSPRTPPAGDRPRLIRIK